MRNNCDRTLCTRGFKRNSILVTRYLFQKYLSVIVDNTFNNLSMISKVFIISNITSVALPNTFNLAFKLFYVQWKMCNIHQPTSDNVALVA